MGKRGGGGARYQAWPLQVRLPKPRNQDGARLRRFRRPAGEGGYEKIMVRVPVFTGVAGCCANTAAVDFRDKSGSLLLRQKPVPAEKQYVTSCVGGSMKIRFYVAVNGTQRSACFSPPRSQRSQWRQATA